MLYYTYNIRRNQGPFLSGWEFSVLGVYKAENKKNTPKKSQPTDKNSLFTKATANTKMHASCIASSFMQDK